MKVDDPDSGFGKRCHGSESEPLGSTVQDVQLFIDQEAALQVPADVPAGAAGHASQSAEDALLYLLERVQVVVGAGRQRYLDDVVGPLELLKSIGLGFHLEPRFFIVFACHSWMSEWP